MPNRSSAETGTADAGRASAQVAWLAFGLVLIAIAFATVGASKAAAQISPRIGIDDSSAFRERSRQQSQSYQNRLQYNHDLSRERALDTAERTRRERERLLDREEQIKRQRSH
jgi:hypothetical protein